MVGTRSTGYTQASSIPVTLSAVKNCRLESKLDLCFPVTRITRYMREMKLADQISVKAGVVMATVLEYMTAELLTTSGTVCTEAKRTRIHPQHIKLAIKKDLEMGDLLGNTLVIPVEGKALKTEKTHKSRKQD